jgi:hypothetical protein
MSTVSVLRVLGYFIFIFDVLIEVCIVHEASVIAIVVAIIFFIVFISC